MDNSIISVLLVIAQMIISSNWKNRNAPLLKKWYEKLVDVFVLEKLSDNLKQVDNPVYYSNFVSIWVKILGFLGTVNPNLLSSAHRDLLFF